MNKHEGSSLESFLEEEGILEECTIAGLLKANGFEKSPVEIQNYNIRRLNMKTTEEISTEGFIGGGSGGINSEFQSTQDI